MSVIEKIKAFLESLDNISSVYIDYMENTGEIWGLYQTSQSVYKEFITGDKEYITNLALYYHTESATDTDRINNIGTMQTVVQALNEYSDETIMKVTAGNPSLFAVPVSLNDGYTYQIQIQLIHE